MRSPGSESRTFSVTRPRPVGTDFHTSVDPTPGQPSSRRSTWPKPSMNVRQRVVSVQSSKALCGVRSTCVARSALAIDLADDLLDRAQDAVEERARVVDQARVFLLALACERVVAAAAALGVLPASLDQAALLE